MSKFAFVGMIVCGQSSFGQEVGCQCDGAGDSHLNARFCRKELESKGSHLVYKCVDSKAANKCFEQISDNTFYEKKPKCSCLQSECLSNQQLLGDGRSTCAEVCMKPKPVHDICADYDDSHAWCEYYAFWQCVFRNPECHHKSQQSACETKCDQEAKLKGGDATRELDTFLICLGSCDHSAMKSIVV